MSLISICQEVAKNVGVLVPSSVVGVNEETAQRLLAAANRAGKWLARRHNWVDLQTEYTFTTVASTVDYSLPADYNRMIDGTLWDRSNYESIRGPLSPQEWQVHKSSVLANTATTWKRFRIRRVGGSKQFSIDPTPDSADSLVLEYVSNNWCLSPEGVGQSSWAGDDDTGILDEYLIELETTWRFMYSLGLAYEEDYNEARNQVNQAVARDGGSPTLSLSRNRSFQLLGPQNVPETGFGSS